MTPAEMKEALEAQIAELLARVEALENNETTRETKYAEIEVAVKAVEVKK